MPPTAPTGTDRQADRAAWPGPDGLPPPAQAGGTSPLDRNALLVIIAVTCFALSDFMASRLADAGVATILLYRHVAYLFAALTFIAVAGTAVSWPARPARQGLRALLNFGSAAFFIAALSWLDVSSATAISFATPALVTLLAIPLLGEVVRRRRAVATVIGLAGVIVLMRPGSGALGWAGLLPLASALCGASAIILTRKIGSGDPAQITVLISALTGLVLSAALAVYLGEPLRLPDQSILLMGALYAAGQILLVVAYRAGETSYLAPFSYAQVPIAAAITAVATSRAPSGIALVGMTLIVSSGAYTLLREGVLAERRMLGRITTSIRRGRRRVSREGEWPLP